MAPGALGLGRVTTLTTVRYFSYACTWIALLIALYLMWRSAQAAANRNEQPADDNDVCFAVAVAGFVVALALLGLTAAVLV